MRTPLQHSTQLLLHIIPQISPVSFTNESCKNVLKDQTLCMDQFYMYTSIS